MFFKKPASLKLPLVLSCMLILSACATTTDTGGTEQEGAGGTEGGVTVLSKSDRQPIALCGATGPLSWSLADTDKTIAGIKIANARWTALCGSRKGGA
ncbi:hypothetical protein [Roseibium litorale]|uniref:Polar amino acid transport system substrate-binding protein n=1 Tax=Roseibium litorale TaxID=2803841 RepID=A0ABR9CJK4_9HYPH|nr:hypothetical protein [Roseibium litorale]MBD8890913.1 hypothetical protein [Roseibium litorale]